ncbi:TolB family protein [Allomuricauda sp. XS_ASV26]|uniref:TolB family protein n=1 Tax=Allomuricauda sp. XS_ASV26 TaxID=3241292 RepID=UPI003515D0A4
MKLINYIVKLCVLTLAIVIIACKTEKKKTGENEFSTNENSLLGQNPPGSTPIPFAPGMVTTSGWEYGGVFTPDMNEFYFLREVGVDSTKKQEFVVYKCEGDKWEKTVISSRQGQPFVAPDGKTMHLGKRYMNRRSNGEWSGVKSLGSPFDSLRIMRLTASSKGTYFFDEFKEDITGDIRYSRIIEGKYEEPKLLNNKINTGKSFHPFIAPDESYIIFDSYRENGFGDSDIYISFRQKDNTWGEPVNLGSKINTQAWEASASVTPDGKYLFFNRNVGPEEDRNVDIFWVDAQFIEKLNPED